MSKEEDTWARFDATKLDEDILFETARDDGYTGSFAAHHHFLNGEYQRTTWEIKGSSPLVEKG